LPTAAVLASRGLDVIGVEVSEKAMSTINAGKNIAPVLKKMIL